VVRVKTFAGTVQIAGGWEGGKGRSGGAGDRGAWAAGARGRPGSMGDRGAWAAGVRGRPGCVSDRGAEPTRDATLAASGR